MCPHAVTRTHANSGVRTRSRNARQRAPARAAREVLQESRMPTARTKAAFRWLMANNTYYKTYTLLQKIAIAVHRIHEDKK